MNAVQKTIPLSIDPGGIEPIINVSQYDAGVREINFDFTDYSLPSDATVKVRGSKTDGKGFVYDASISPEGKVSIFVEDQMTACAGLVRCELEIRSKESPSTVIHTARFILKVDKSPLDDTTVISDSELSLLETAGNSARAAAESASAAKASETNASKSATSAAQSASAAKISAEAANRAEKANADAIAQETESRRAGEKNLTSAIDTETTRATAAENTLSDAIEAETAARTSADNTFSAHIKNSENPHKVTKAQVGLGNVDNTADADKNVKHAADSATVNGHTVNSDVPANAKFTDTTYSAFAGATASAGGSTGLVPRPTIEDADKYLCGDGTWKTVSGGTGTSDKPVEVEAELSTAVASGTVTVYRIGHLLHVYAEDLSVKWGAGVPVAGIISLPNIGGFSFKRSAVTWAAISATDGTTENYGLAFAALDEMKVPVVALFGKEGSTQTGIYFSMTVPLLDS